MLLERRADYWREKPHIDSVLLPRRHRQRGRVERAAARRARRRPHRTTTSGGARKTSPRSGRRSSSSTPGMLSYNCFVWNLERSAVHRRARAPRAGDELRPADAVIEKLYHGQARPVTGPFLARSVGEQRRHRADRVQSAAAAALLASAGWRDIDGDGVLDRDGREFAFTLLIPAGNGARAISARSFRTRCEKVGVKTGDRADRRRGVLRAACCERNFQAAFLCVGHRARSRSVSTLFPLVAEGAGRDERRRLCERRGGSS